jgi:hypothetical protein
MPGFLHSDKRGVPVAVEPVCAPQASECCAVRCAPVVSAKLPHGPPVGMYGGSVPVFVVAVCHLQSAGIHSAGQLSLGVVLERVFKHALAGNVARLLYHASVAVVLVVDGVAAARPARKALRGVSPGAVCVGNDAAAGLDLDGPAQVVESVFGGHAPAVGVRQRCSVGRVAVGVGAGIGVGEARAVAGNVVFDGHGGSVGCYRRWFAV